MAIKKSMLDALRDFLTDEEIDDEWFMLHTTVTIDSSTRHLTIEIDKVNQQELSWIEEEL